MAGAWSIPAVFKLTTNKPGHLAGGGARESAPESCNHPAPL
jgi:hypothetical protein